MSNFYSFTPIDNKGKKFPLIDLKGKVVLIVNTASKCGFTKQYAGLQSLYKKYKSKDVVVVGFPCNQFAQEEPGSAEEIAKFCSLNFGVTFPLMKKIDVNGANTEPVYKWLKDQNSGLLGLNPIKWNFEKFLIGKNGEVIERYASETEPETIEEDIKKLL